MLDGLASMDALGRFDSRAQATHAVALWQNGGNSKRLVERIHGIGLSSAAVEAFRADGFAKFGPLADDALLKELRRDYAAILNGEIDAGKRDRQLGGVTRQVMFPQRVSPLFADNPALRQAKEIAAALLCTGEPEFYFSMLIDKPAGHPHETPWHQDAAYFQLPFSQAGTSFPSDVIVQFWLALEDVDEEMGCMAFRPGLHKRPLLPHHVASGDPMDDARLLGIDAAALADAPAPVPVPLRAGWATAHSYTTPHFTGPNRSSRPRPAYIFSFQNAARVEELRARFPFVAGS